MSLKNDIQEIFYSEEEIKKRVAELGQELSEIYQDKNPLLVGVLKGASLFMADLVREMDIYLDIDFMDLSSYGGGTESSGDVKILKDLSTSAEGRHILFVEDIVDTGRTLAFLNDLFQTRKAASVNIVTLLDKPSRRVEDLPVQWVGFEIPDAFIVGYGLDYDERYRNLPYIGILKDEFIQA